MEIITVVCLVEGFLKDLASSHSMTFRLTRDSFGVPGTGITNLNNAVCDGVSAICGASVHAMNMVYASTDCIFLDDSETHVA